MRRKDFILNTGGLILSSFTSANLLASVHSSNSLNSQINIGVIGTGSRGQGLIKLLNLGGSSVSSKTYFPSSLIV